MIVNFSGTLYPASLAALKRRTPEADYFNWG